MKILYAIQGTGNGHISRARDIVPILKERGDLDILISGTEDDVELPHPVKFRLKGLSFVFGKKGGVDLLSTYKKSNLKQLFREIKNLPVEEYDIIINDFEPVSAWACRLKNKACIGLSHQLAVINKKSPKPSGNDFFGEAILKNYAPVTNAYGFHFKTYDDHIYTPVIRQQVRNAVIEKNNHFTVYLPAYEDKIIIRILREIHKIQWVVFSKHSKKPYHKNNIHIRPINNDEFIKSLVGCSGILCGAGFETPAEALFLNKKLLVIPMKGQYEQQCNAAALKKMGIDVLKTLKSKQIEKIKSWVKSSPPIHVNYRDATEEIIDLILQNHHSNSQKQEELHLGNVPFSLKKLKQLTLDTIRGKNRI
ncbi:MAG: glycosyltransferase family protein [Ginsengibacter sp.]